MKGGQEDGRAEREIEPLLLRMNTAENNLLVDGNEREINACPQEAHHTELEETMPHNGSYQGPRQDPVDFGKKHLHVLKLET